MMNWLKAWTVYKDYREEYNVPVKEYRVALDNLKAAQKACDIAEKAYCKHITTMPTPPGFFRYSQFNKEMI